MISLHHGDCLEIMPTLPDASIDMILCDLPYGMVEKKWDKKLDLARLWVEYRRLIRGNGAIVLTALQPFTTDLINAARDLFKYNWVWEKNIIGDPFNAKNKPMRGHEDILVFSKGTTANKSKRRMPYFPQGLKDCGRLKKNNRAGLAHLAPRPSHPEEYFISNTGYPKSILTFPCETGYHFTQKPVPLLEYLIRTYTTEGQIILDNCMGSGSTGVACIRANRDFIGIELDTDYFRVAQERLIEEENAKAKT